MKPQPTRKYTPEEKEQLIKNLDIEVEHRVRQLEEWLAVALENFRLHQEGLISRIPKLVRTISMGEFSDKYDGDVQACLRGMQSERMGVNGIQTEAFEIDRETRKRKWAEAQEEVGASGSGSGSGQGQEGDNSRAVKNARMMTATPKKPTAPPPSNRAFPAVRTPGPLRTTTTTSARPSPSPHKLNKPPSFVPVRMSPVKQTNTTTTAQRARPPSSATFNPSMVPAKAPTYPTLRAPRRDESMLSVNGSPLANPYTLGLGWFAGEEPFEEDVPAHAGTGKSKGKGKGKEKQDAAQAPKTLRRVNSIVIRRDPSGTLDASSSSSPSQPHSNDPSSRTQSRTNSHTQSQSQSHSHTRSNSRTQLLDPTPAPPPPNLNPNPTVHRVPSTSTSSALVSIPTSDGHLLEFDPLTTSPRALDKLVGITDSAKKHAKEEMARLVKEAVRKWVIE